MTMIRTATEGHLLIITMDRPEVLNSLNAAGCFELDRVWNDFAADPDLWIAIITGAGRAFCAGHDLADKPDEPMPESGWAGIAERAPIGKPIIAAVNGAAYGGGCEILLAADIVVIDETARLALSEPKVGGIAMGGGAQRLMRKIPAAIAMGMLLTGRSIDAAEAHRWGLVNEVAPHGTALVRARKWADDILACSPLAVQQTKMLALDALEGDLPQRIKAQGKRLLSEIFQWEDTQEGIAAFLEKRAPNWLGR